MRRAAMLLAVLSGCVRHVALSTAELQNLNGFGSEEARAAYAVTDRDGEGHPFNAQSKLYLVDDRGRRKGGAFKALQIEENTLTGELVDGTQLVADLAKVDRAELDLKDRTAGIGIAVGLLLALAAIIAVGVMAGQSQF
jgi:hypothetical protein